MAKKQKQIVSFSGIDFILFPKARIMMMMSDIQVPNLEISRMHEVSAQGKNLYFSQKAARLAAGIFFPTLDVPRLRLPSYDEWITCIDQVQSLQKTEIVPSRWTHDSEFLISRRLLDKEVHGAQAIAALELSHNGYRYAKTDIHCRNPRDGRYWTSTPGQYIHLEGPRIWFNCFTEVNRGFSVRLIADIPSEFLDTDVDFEVTIYGGLN